VIHLESPDMARHPPVRIVDPKNHLKVTCCPRAPASLTGRRTVQPGESRNRMVIASNSAGSGAVLDSEPAPPASDLDSTGDSRVPGHMLRVERTPTI